MSARKKKPSEVAGKKFGKRKSRAPVKPVNAKSDKATGEALRKAQAECWASNWMMLYRDYAKHEMMLTIENATLALQMSGERIPFSRLPDDYDPPDFTCLGGTKQDGTKRPLRMELIFQSEVFDPLNYGKAFFEECAEALLSNDSAFFKKVAVLVKARKGKSLSLAQWFLAQAVQNILASGKIPTCKEAETAAIRLWAKHRLNGLGDRDASEKEILAEMTKIDPQEYGKRNTQINWTRVRQSAGLAWLKTGRPGRPRKGKEYDM